MGAPGTDLTGFRWVRGRSNRLDYGLWTAILLFVGFRATMAPGPLVQLIGGLLAIAVLVRRFHDLGFSGWWTLALIFGQLVVYAIAAAVIDEQTALPVATLALLVAQLILGLIPGQRTANRFGPPPGRRQRVADEPG